MVFNIRGMNTVYGPVTGSEYEQVLREKGTPDYIVQKKMYINLFGA